MVGVLRLITCQNIGFLIFVGLCVGMGGWNSSLSVLRFSPLSRVVGKGDPCAQVFNFLTAIDVRPLDSVHRGGGTLGGTLCGVALKSSRDFVVSFVLSDVVRDRVKF